MKILVVEDNLSIAETIGDYFSLQGHLSEFAYNGVMALEIVQEEEFDVMVLDVMMPKMDGLELIKRLRGEGNQTPVLMLTARDTLEDRLLGFDLGVDDYLVKPFAMEELQARLKAICVRGKRSDIGEIVVGDLQIFLGRARVVREGKSLTLNKIQFNLLKKLALESPDVVSRQSLEYQIWGDELPNSDALRTHIYRLRNVIDKDFMHPMIETIHSKGFRLVA